MLLLLVMLYVAGGVGFEEDELDGPHVLLPPVLIDEDKDEGA